jgi:hypothetical protein
LVCIAAGEQVGAADVDGDPWLVTAGPHPLEAELPHAVSTDAAEASKTAAVAMRFTNGPPGGEMTSPHPVMQGCSHDR